MLPLLRSLITLSVVLSVVVKEILPSSTSNFSSAVTFWDNPIPTLPVEPSNLRTSVSTPPSFTLNVISLLDTVFLIVMLQLRIVMLKS